MNDNNQNISVVDLTRREILSDSLPKTLCTPAMRHELEKLSLATGLTVSELLRRAVSLFLREVDRKPLIIDSELSDTPQLALVASQDAPGRTKGRTRG